MFAQDLRLTMRHLLKSPVFSALAVIMLALGIGASTAMFSLVEGILLRPLPFPEPDRLAYLSEAVPNFDDDKAVTAPGMQEYICSVQSFSHLGGIRRGQPYALSGQGAPTQVKSYRFTSGVLPALGVQPHMGRFFTQAEDEQKLPVVVVTHAFWQKHLKGNSAAVGTPILLDREPYQVIGVMPSHFLLPGDQVSRQGDLCFVPMRLTPEEVSNTGSWSFQMLGRLKPGVTLKQAESDAERITQLIATRLPASCAHIRLHAKVTSVQEDLVGPHRPLVRTLFLAAGTVLGTRS